MREEEYEVKLLTYFQTSTIASRYQQLVLLPVNDPNQALQIESSHNVKGIDVKISGFIFRTLLASRNHQHIVVNGKTEETEERSELPQAIYFKSIVLDVLNESLLRPGNRASNDLNSHRQYAFFLKLDTSSTSATDHDLRKCVRAALQDSLRADSLLPEKEIASGKRHQDPIRPQAPVKRFRDDQFEHSLLAAKSSNSIKAVLLDRGSLRREPNALLLDSPAPTWLAETLDRYQKVRPSDAIDDCKVSCAGYDEFSTGFDDGNVQSMNVDGLQRSYTVGQVDCKFICIYQGGDTLSLVDQHAAHERVRLEAMLSDYVDDCLEAKDKMINALESACPSIQISESVIAIYREDAMKKVLGFWGLPYDIEEIAGDHTLQFHSFPAILTAKLRQDKVLYSLVTQLASCLEQNGIHREQQRLRSGVASRQGEKSTRDKVLFAQRFLPSPLLDLFNSISCRGAISE